MIKLADCNGKSWISISGFLQYQILSLGTLGRWRNLGIAFTLVHGGRDVPCDSADAGFEETLLK